MNYRRFLITSQTPPTFSRPLSPPNPTRPPSIVKYKPLLRPPYHGKDKENFPDRQNTQQVLHRKPQWCHYSELKPRSPEPQVDRSITTPVSPQTKHHQQKPRVRPQDDLPGIRFLHQHLKNVQHYNRTLRHGKPPRPSGRPLTINTSRKFKVSGSISPRAMPLDRCASTCSQKFLLGSHSKLPKKRRGQLYSSNVFQRYYEYLSKQDVIYHIDKILEYYSQILSLGTTVKKLTQLVRRLCMDKDDLIQVIMECSKEDPLTDVVTYQLRRDRTQIFNRLKEVAFSKDYSVFEHIVSEVILFKSKLQQAVIEDRKRKIDNLSKSIGQYRHQNSHCKLDGFFVVEQFAPKPSYHKMIGSALSHMERKYGGFKRITDYSLQVYGCLSEAEENSKKVQVDRKANTGMTAAAADRSRIVFPKN